MVGLEGRKRAESVLTQVRLDLAPRLAWLTPPHYLSHMSWSYNLRRRQVLVPPIEESFKDLLAQGAETDLHGGTEEDLKERNKVLVEILYVPNVVPPLD